LTDICTVPAVTGVEPAVTWASPPDSLHPVSTTDGIVSVVVVAVTHGPVQVTGCCAVAPLDSSVARTVPAAVALQARAASIGSAVVNAPPPTVWQMA
jgi:hypothetical protein